jgi:serine/threonine protein kinase/Flp pilus assembly protein TadD
MIGTDISDIMLQYRHSVVHDLQVRVLNASVSTTSRIKSPFSRLIEQPVAPLEVKAHWNRPQVTVKEGQIELSAEVKGGARQVVTGRILTLDGEVSVRQNPIIAVDAQGRPYACVDPPGPQSLNMRKLKVTYEGSHWPGLLAKLNPAKEETLLRPVITTQLFGRLARIPLTYMPSSFPIAAPTRKRTVPQTLPIVRTLAGTLDKSGSVALALMLDERHIPPSTFVSLLPENAEYNAAIGISTAGLNTLLTHLCQQGQAIGQFHHSRLGLTNWRWEGLTVTLLNRTILIEGVLFQQGLRVWVQAEVQCWLDDSDIVRCRLLSGNIDASVAETVLASWIEVLNTLLCAPAARKQHKDMPSSEPLTQVFEIPTTTQTVKVVAQELLVMNEQLIVYYTIPMSLKTLPLEISPPKPGVTIIQPHIPHQLHQGAPVTTKVEARITKDSVQPYDYAWTTDLSPEPALEHGPSLTIHAIPPPVPQGGQQQLITAHLKLIDMFGQVSEVQAPVQYIAATKPQQRALGKMKRHKDGVFAYDQDIRLNPNYADAYYNKGLALLDLQRHEEAIQAFDQAIRRNPNYADTYHNKGLALNKLKRYEEAIQAFDQAIRLNPSSADTYHNKGLALNEMERYEEAIQAFDQTIRLNPDDANAYYNKGVALNKLRHYEEAIAAYDEAIRLNPNYVSAYDNKGNALYSLKHYEEAIAAYDEAIQLDPNDATAYNNKGLTLRELKRHEESRITLEEETIVAYKVTDEQDTHVPPPQELSPSEEPIVIEYAPAHTVLVSKESDNRFGNYDLLRFLNAGNIGYVYLARQHNVVGREVVMKIIHPALKHDKFTRQCFHREAEMSAYLKNEHIPPLVEFGEEEGSCFLVTSFIKGGSLNAKLKHGPLVLTEIRQIFTALLEAISHLHKRGVVHGNLNPYSILLDKTEDGKDLYMRLINLYMASVQGSPISPLPSTAKVDVKAYAAPERLNGIIEVSDDIYSLGVILFQMITGKLPYQDKTYPLIEELEPLISVAMRCMEYLPENRYNNVDGLLGVFKSTCDYVQKREQSTVPLEPIEPSLGQEPTLIYGISVDISLKEVSIGGEVEVVLSLGLADRNSTYLLEVPEDQIAGLELNTLLTAPHFHINGENVSSLPLDLVTAQDIDANGIHSQTARFSLTALRSGPCKLQLDLYTSDVFKTSLEYTVDVARIDQTTPSSIHDLTQPRPVRHPDLIFLAGTQRR